MNRKPSTGQSFESLSQARRLWTWIEPHHGDDDHGVYVTHPGLCPDCTRSVDRGPDMAQRLLTADGQ